MHDEYYEVMEKRGESINQRITFASKISRSRNRRANGERAEHAGGRGVHYETSVVLRWMLLVALKLHTYTPTSFSLLTEYTYVYT